MWNWEWQRPADHGTRYDIGLLETHRRVLQQWRAHNVATPAYGWIVSKLDGGSAFALPMPHTLIDQQQWLTQEGRACHGCGETGRWELTRGGIAACWAISQAPIGARVILVGFDVIKAGIAPAVDEAFSPAYQASGGFWGIDGFTPGSTKEGNHDYPAERRLIELVAARKGGVTVAFAEDVWP